MMSVLIIDFFEIVHVTDGKGMSGPETAAEIFPYQEFEGRLIADAGHRIGFAHILQSYLRIISPHLIADDAEQRGSRDTERDENTDRIQYKFIAALRPETADQINGGRNGCFQNRSDRTSRIDLRHQHQTQRK